jgi:serine/threonine-protein kinase
MTGATDLRVIAGRYALEGLVGKGGMGEVWRARHLTLKSKVAIKFLHAASASSETSRRRFLTEAQVTANLKSKHAVQVFDFGVTDDGMPFLVMELLEGETLDKRIARLGRLSIRSTVRILRQAARALDRAHALGIVHRDFKPENIVILQDDEGHDEVKILDFGVAKLVGELEPGREPSALDGDDILRKPSATTRTGTVVGTPYYMAPEQIHDSANVGPSADIWALGVVAYECLTGQRPFENDTVAAVLRDILDGKSTPASAHHPDLPPMFDDWFQAACAATPEARFSDALTAVVALGIALEDADHQPAVSRHPPTTASAAGPHIKTHWSALAETMAAEPATSVPPDQPSSKRHSGAASTPGELPPATAVTTARSTRRGRRLRVLLYMLAAVSLVGVGMILRPVPKTRTVFVTDDPSPTQPERSQAASPTGPAAQLPSAHAAEPPTAAHVEPSAPPTPTDTARATHAGVPAKAPAPSASASAAASAPATATPTATATATTSTTSKPAAPSPFKLPELGL